MKFTGVATPLNATHLISSSEIVFLGKTWNNPIKGCKSIYPSSSAIEALS
jgi:hypothetical protein